MNLAQALSTIEVPLPNKRRLLAFVLGVTQEYVVAHPERDLSADELSQFSALCAQLEDGVPLAYLIQEQGFFGLPFYVNPDVLIPRPDTEVLVEHVLSTHPGNSSLRVVDLGTGSGCIAITLAQQRPAWTVLGVDKSEAALRVAARNSRRHQLNVQWICADWLSGVPGPFDLIVSNPPYIPQNDPHLDALHHEPRSALTDDSDGLQHLATIARQARACLRPGGRLVMEHGYDQGESARLLLTALGYTQVATQIDSMGHPRVVHATWAG